MRKMKVMTFALIAALTLTFSTGCSEKSGLGDASTATAQEVGVSALKANPEKYLGALKVDGQAGNVFPNDGVIEISDDKACCSIYLFVPFTTAQQENLKTATLYTGSMPAVGQQLSVTGLLEKSPDGYRFIVYDVKSNDSIIIARK